VFLYLSRAAERLLIWWLGEGRNSQAALNQGEKWEQNISDLERITVTKALMVKTQSNNNQTVRDKNKPPKT